MNSISRELSNGINFCRIIACFLVIILHASALNFYKFDGDWWKSNLFDSLSRICVPLFIMITGALLINEQGKKYSSLIKRFKKIIIVCLFWSLFYTLADKIHPITPAEWIKRVIKNEFKFHLWYLYAMVGFYLSIPILSAIYTGLSKKNLLYVVVIWGVASNIDLIYSEGMINSNLLKLYSMTYFSDLIGYLILGKLLSDLFNFMINRYMIGFLILCYLVSTAMIYLLTYIISIKGNSPNPFFYTYNSIFVIISSTTIFIPLLYIGSVLGNRDKFNVVKKISGLTLGVYCIHLFYMDLSVAVLTHINMNKPGFLFIIIISVLTLFLSLFSIGFMKKIPFLNKVI